MRLLIGLLLMPSVIGTGYAVAAPGVPAGVLTLLDPPDGGFMTHIQQPRAVSYNGYTYIGFVHSSGAIKVSAVNESTGLVVSTQTLRTFSADTHDTPALWVRASDHKLLVAYCHHDGAVMYLSTSDTSLTTDPDLGDGFTEANITSQIIGGGAGWDDMTYPILLQLMDEASDPIYLFWREYHDTGRLAMSKSTNGGTTWSARVLISAMDGSIPGGVPYWNIITNGTDRFDVFTSDGTDSTGGTKVYHWYYTAGAYKQSDGTAIDYSAGYFLPSAGTLVLDDSAGRVDRAFGVAWDGAPAGILKQLNGSSDVRWVSVRWRSGAWQTDTIIDSNGGGIAGNLYIPGAAMNHADPDEVVLARLISGKWEMYRYTSADDGVTWTPSALTTGSASDNMHPSWVWNASADIEAVWSYGSYTNGTTFSLGLRGVAP